MCVLIFFCLNSLLRRTSILLCVWEEFLLPYTLHKTILNFDFTIPLTVWAHSAGAFKAFTKLMKILVQHGSYPVVNVNNKTFQGYMYIQRSQLHKLTLHAAYQPHDASVLPVYNPLPGSWFAAAYIPNWTEQMQQEGIIHKCRYSLGSIAMWTQKDHVKTLNVGMTQTIHTKENLSYYRFFVPSNTWYLEVKLTSCHIWERRMDPDTGSVMFRWCANSIVLEARSLPLIPLGQSSNPNNSNNSVITNITEAGRHVFYERHPYADGYYYLLVNTEGETLLDVTITTKECVSGFQKTRNHMYSISKSVLREATSELQQTSSSERNLSNITLFEEEENISNILLNTYTYNMPMIIISLKPEKALGGDYNSDESSSSQECYPVLPLERIKHTTDFTDTFLIQGPEWYSSWVAVHATMPLYTHFTLLPFTDIGGTLSVNIHMDEVLMNPHEKVSPLNPKLSIWWPPYFVLDQLRCSSRLHNEVESSAFQAQSLFPAQLPQEWFLNPNTVDHEKGAVPRTQALLVLECDTRAVSSLLYARGSRSLDCWVYTRFIHLLKFSFLSCFTNHV
ncbi:unnamed protein product [Meganyctiphanes norvegica]|uniref:Uncharacterized protein n=1 Tax=Meganyctiphanes norvegica TaxID=48144 RepID=A0AAV2S339_MEGNR